MRMSSSCATSSRSAASGGRSRRCSRPLGRRGAQPVEPAQGAQQHGGRGRARPRAGVAAYRCSGRGQVKKNHRCTWTPGADDPLSPQTRARPATWAATAPTAAAAPTTDWRTATAAPAARSTTPRGVARWSALGGRWRKTCSSRRASPSSGTSGTRSQSAYRGAPSTPSVTGGTGCCRCKRIKRLRNKHRRSRRRRSRSSQSSPPTQWVRSTCRKSSTSPSE